MWHYLAPSVKSSEYIKQMNLRYTGMALKIPDVILL
jgi:hypothetical protein